MSCATTSKVDSAAGTAVTALKEGWWQHVQGATMTPEDGKILQKVVVTNFRGDMQILDGMDTLTATLNWVRSSGRAARVAVMQTDAVVRISMQSICSSRTSS